MLLDLQWMGDAMRYWSIAILLAVAKSKNMNLEFKIFLFVCSLNWFKGQNFECSKSVPK